MASSGKKGKKTKGKTLALNDFLQETPGATPTIPIRKTNINWADEVEDISDQYESRTKANVVLPTAPKASRGFDEFTEKIPHQPPYIAYLSNLPYDVNEDEIADFFRELKIINMRIPKEDRAGEAPRLKGFGYIEFDDRESLVGALSIIDCTLKNRRIRIEVATNSDNDRRRGGRMDSNRDRMDRPEITSGDWRSGPRAEPSEPERNRGGFNRDREGGFNRDREGGFNRDREGGGFDRDRGSWRDAGDRPSFRDSDRDRGFQRDMDRGSGYRDGYGDKSRGFGSRRNDDREFTRGGGRDDMGSDRSEARTRPKLVLAPRTRPIEAPSVSDSDKETTSNAIPISVPPPSSCIFGNARPVDTSAREREIEDRLAKTYEKPADSSRDSRQDIDRRGWGRRDERRDSPKRYSPRRGSPEYRRDYSPPNRSRNYDRRADSPSCRRGSPDRDGSPNYQRKSPEPRRSSFDRGSPRQRGQSPDNRNYSPENRRGSSDRRWNSPNNRKSSPERSSPDRESPEPPRGSPERERNSLDRKRGSIDRSQSSRGSYQGKSDEKDGKRGSVKTDRSLQRNEKDKHKRDEKLPRDNHDREMPKLKEPEPPNFAASNKFAFLSAEGDSD